MRSNVGEVTPGSLNLRPSKGKDGVELAAAMKFNVVSSRLRHKKQLKEKESLKNKNKCSDKPVKKQSILKKYLKVYLNKILESFSSSMWYMQSWSLGLKL